MGSGTRSSKRVNIPYIMHDTCLCQLDVKMTNNYHNILYVKSKEQTSEA